MNRKAFFLTLAVFLLGVALGAGGFYMASERVSATNATAESRHAGKRGPRPSLVERLTQELALTPAQQQQVCAVLEATSQKYEAAYAPVRAQSEALRPQMEAIRKDGRQNIRALLNAEQLAAFERYIERVDQDRARMDQERKAGPCGAK
jgi:hypothetical protein